MLRRSSLSHLELSPLDADAERASSPHGIVVDTEEQAPPLPYDEQRDLFGLSLSGGGIRSATFNLGLLQALDELRILPVFDFMSTVSGGGYIGAFLTAWRSRALQPCGRGPGFPHPPQDTPGIEPPEIRHLREFSNFLSPRLGVFSYDTGRMIVALLSGMLPSLLASLAIILAALTAWVGVACGVFAWQVRSCRVGAAAWLVFRPEGSDLSNGRLVSVATVAALTFITCIAWESGGRRRLGKDAKWLVYLLATLVGTVAASVVWSLWLSSPHGQSIIYPTDAPGLPLGGQRSPHWVALLAPALAWIAAAATLAVLRWLTSQLAGSEWMQPTRRAFDRVNSRLLFAGGLWILLAVLWSVGSFIWAGRAGGLSSLGKWLAGLGAAITALTGTLARVQSVMGREPNRQAGSATSSQLRKKLPALIAYAALGGIVLAVVLLMHALVDGGYFGTACWIAAVASALVLVLFNPNEIGLHAFYRARLARAYIGASNLAGGRLTEEQPGDDLALTAVAPTRPLHLVCCAVNDLAPADPLATLNRGAVSGVLSKVGFLVGTRFAPWPQGDVPTLAAAITASAAAFNSQMGAKSVELGPAVTFLLTTFNLRLGLWLPHPSSLGSDIRFRSALPGRAFYRELFGRTSATARLVHLSDGGHFENMALYELIRRRCRYIVASDCGADPEVSFDDFGNMLRRVREDFGVEIAIDLSPLRPDEDGHARQAMVAGDIQYPDGDTGVLLLFKPTLVGNEPPDVTQYRRRNPDFPHESTGDQFYDEAQWESYRRLGRYAGMAAFHDITRDLRPAGPDDVVMDELLSREWMPALRSWGAKVFARARKQWLPVPEAFVERLGQLVSRAAELDAVLQKPECGPVLSQVYKEIDELDRLARTPRRESPDTLAAEPPALGTLDQKTLAASLHAIRRALLFMEDVYVAEDLEHRYNQPLYLGLINYFARWACAPLFRMWWPLLKTMYAERFTAFMESHFNLVSITPLPADGVDAKLERLSARIEDARGFASYCWTLEHPDRELGADEHFVYYQLHMEYRVPDGSPPMRYPVQAAQVLTRRQGYTVMWDARDFYVPPGLWGVGIGEDFLARLVRVEALPDALRDARHLLVRIAFPKNAPTAARKESADLAQLYRAAGFFELPPPRHSTVLRVHGNPEDAFDIARIALDDQHASRWLIRCLKSADLEWSDRAHEWA